MLSIIFPVPPGQPPIAIAPASRLQVAGHVLQAAGHAKPVTVYQHGFWHIGNQAYTSFEIHGPARIHGEDRAGRSSATIGPFELLKFCDGALRVGDAGILALHDDRSDEWCLYPEAKYYLMLVID